MTPDFSLSGRRRDLPRTTPNEFASGTHDPKKWCPVFGQDHAQRRGRRSAERRIQPIPRSTGQRCRLPMPWRGGAPCRQVYAVCALICLRGALAFRRYTAGLARTFASWLSSRPCLRDSVRAGIFPAFSGSRPVEAPSASAVLPKGMMPEATPAQVASPRGSTALAPHFRSHPECVPRWQSLACN